MILLPILHLENNIEGLREEYKLNALEVKNILFFVINAVTAYEEDNIEYCLIYSNGKEYISTLTMEEIQDMYINNLKKKKI